MMFCRSCGKKNLDSIIALGTLPVANRFLNEKRDYETRCNLEVMLCKSCGLAQLKDLINPKDLFSDYLYFSSNSEGMLHSASLLVDRIESTLPKDALVIEIASNDGYLLKNYKNTEVLGIDPAANIAKLANEAGITTLCDFFSDSLALALAAQEKKADIIHANNVMAHVPDINGFVRGIRILLKKSGQAIIEVPHFLELLQKLEFDTIYHEHVYYFGLKPLIDLFERHGLEIYEVERIPLHGGTLRLFVGHKGQHCIGGSAKNILSLEENAQLYEVATYKIFMERVASLRENLLSLLSLLKSEGKKIVAYGASAKGTTLLNYFGISSDSIDFVVDRSKAKQGKLTPGTQLEIREPDALEQADYAVLLSWNFADEIVRQQIEFVKRGGRFILPLPEVKIIP